MSIVLDAFPKLTKTLLEETKYTCNVVGSTYSSAFKPIVLKEEQKSKTSITFKVSDNNGIWHPKDYGLNIEYHIHIDDTAELFGEHGIAYANGDCIGVAVLWKDAEASVQGCFKVGEFCSNDKVYDTTYVAKLPAGTLRGKLVTEVVLYLKSIKIKETKMPYARQPGTILGELFQFVFIIEGNGSVFPIMEVAGKKTEPLWWVEWNCDDPDVDMFNRDHFCIMLNKNNFAYPYLYENGVENPVLMVEIISSALQILIHNVYSFGFDGSVNYTPGSVHHMVDYLMKTFELTYNPEESQNLSKTLRSVLIQLMMGGQK